MDGWNTTFLLGWPIFRGELLVSGRVFLRGVGSPVFFLLIVVGLGLESNEICLIPINILYIYSYVGISKNRGKTPQIIHLFIGFSTIFTIHFQGKPLFLVQHPCITWGKFLRKPNSLTNNKNTNELLNSCESKVPPPRPY